MRIEGDKILPGEYVGQYIYANLFGLRDNEDIQDGFTIHFNKDETGLEFRQCKRDV